MPQSILVIVVVVLGGIAAWGILESVLIASIFTLVEVGGLLIIIATAIHAGLPIVAALANRPPLELGALSGVAFGSLLALFAFSASVRLVQVMQLCLRTHHS